MGKNIKPRLNFTLDDDSKAFLDAWAQDEHRSTANLIELIVLEAIAKKKLTVTSDRKT
ncbi:hypothetical protein H6G04_29975 [Calothrix membranacea FACHB-236]|nr:hypothetical protein [Calothrix membranacea FACHB-236]